MAKKLLGLILIFLLIFGSSCQVIYKNRIPVTKAKKRNGWYKPNYKKRKRTKTVWMKVHKGNFKKDKNDKMSPSSGNPDREN